MNINYNDLLSGQEEDRVEDVSLEVMRKMDDVTLSNFCKTSTYYKSLCESVIWLERINSAPGLSLLLPYRSHYKDLQDFYFNVRNDAQYAITYEDEVGAGVVCVSNHIKILYEELFYLALQGIDPEIKKTYSRNELLTLIVHDRMGLKLQIIIRFDGVIDQDQTDQYTIYSNAEGTSGYLNPNILSYPILREKEVYCIIEDQYGGSPQRSFSFFNLDDKSLRQAHLLKRDIRLLFKIQDIGTIPNYTLDLKWMKFGFFDVEYDDTTLLLVDYSLLGLQPGTYNILLSDGTIRVIAPHINDESNNKEVREIIENNIMFAINNRRPTENLSLIEILRIFTHFSI